jgi:hypothetical protein
MPYNTSTGVYTPAAGATTATAGQIIASATWNGIFNDLTTAMTTLGQASVIDLNGGKGASYFTATATAINFAATAGTDIATFTVPVPATFVGFRVDTLMLANASASLGGAVVSLFTAAGGGGVTIISSTATTVTSSLTNTSNSAQVLVPASGSNVMVKTSILVLRITTSVTLTTAPGTADAVVKIEPWY